MLPWVWCVSGGGGMYFSSLVGYAGHMVTWKCSVLYEVFEKGLDVILLNPEISQNATAVIYTLCL